MALRLADAMFPEPLRTPEEYETIYPPRPLPPGARVTRIAPSPTGYLHLGTLFTASINYITAHQSGGVFFFRLEDTDKKREVENGAADIVAGLQYYGLPADEGYFGPDDEKGDYGPYQQSKRASIYHAYVKQLVRQGLAYPCFCSAEELDRVRAQQEAARERTGYYGRYARCRDLTPEQALEKIRAGLPYVVRLRSPGDPEKRIRFDDLIKGTIEMPENDQDIVLLKSDGIPTYHFAHAIDDHLMRTTHVIRGDEWIASVPIHLQLFRILGFKAPKYAHVSPIMKEENGCKRKLSKRKDPEAAVHYYAEQGYPADSVMEYLLTIANSDFEEWRRTHPADDRSAFPFSLKKMSLSGALFDLNKLNDVSKNRLCLLSAPQITRMILDWAEENDPPFYRCLHADEAFAEKLFAIDRGGPKPRKDLARLADAPAYAAYFYDELFDGRYDWPENVKAEDIAAILRTYLPLYDPALDRQQWFDGLKALAPSLGFCPEVKEYKKDPQAWRGHVGDISTVLRVAVTGRRNTPDLHSILQLLGKEKVTARLQRALDKGV
ncbi:MAG: glutamate--tRNA ligase [Clostridia bacterium]|nr:glutamate--tRNA ligase [Clostridia bacterium]